MLALLAVLSVFVAGVASEGAVSVLFLLIAFCRLSVSHSRAWPILTAFATTAWLIGLLVFIATPSGVLSANHWEIFNYAISWNWDVIIFTVATVTALICSLIEIISKSGSKVSITDSGSDDSEEIGRFRVFVFTIGSFTACIISPNVFRIPYALLFGVVVVLNAIEYHRLTSFLRKGVYSLTKADLSPFRQILLFYSCCHIIVISILRISSLFGAFPLVIRQFLGILPYRGTEWDQEDWFLLLSMIIHIFLFMIFSRAYFRHAAQTRAADRNEIGNVGPIHPLLRAKTDPVPIPNVAESQDRPEPRASILLTRPISPDNNISDDNGIGSRPSIQNGSDHSPERRPRPLALENEDQRSFGFRPDQVITDVIPAVEPHANLAMPEIARAGSAPDRLHIREGSSVFEDHKRNVSAGISMMITSVLRNFEISICIFALVVVFAFHRNGFNLALMVFVFFGLLMGNRRFSEIAPTFLVPVAVIFACCAFIFFSVPWLYDLNLQSIEFLGITRSTWAIPFRMLLFVCPPLILSLYCRGSANRRALARAPLSVDSIIHAAIEGDENFIDMALARDRDFFVSAVDERGRTALHSAVLHSHIESVEIVLHRGGVSLLNVLDADGRSALELSTHSRITKLLLRYGADTSHRWESQQVENTEKPLFSWESMKEQLSDIWSKIRRMIKAALILYGAKIALLIVFFVGLSKIDLLHIGYVLIALLYVSMPKLSTRRDKWLPLAMFCAAALLCQYGATVVNIAPDGKLNTIFQSIGLIPLDPFFASFFAPALATAFCISQLHFINERQRSIWEESSSSWNTSGIQYVVNFSSVFNQAFLNFGSLIVCGALFLISMLESPTLFNCGYLILGLAALLMAALTSGQARRRSQLLWSFSVAYTASVVFLQYAVQYDVVSSLVENIIRIIYDPVQREYALGLDSIGMPKINTVTDSLFLHLLPALTVFFLTVSFFRINYFGAYTTRNSLSTWTYLMIRQGSKRLSICSKHVSKIVALLPLVAFCIHPSVVSFFYVFGATFLMLRYRGFRHVWLLELVLVSISTFSRYIFQIQPIQTRLSGATADYLGFNVVRGGLLQNDGFRGEVMLLFCIFTQRYFAKLSFLAKEIEVEDQHAFADVAIPTGGPVQSHTLAVPMNDRENSPSGTSSEIPIDDKPISRLVRLRKILLSFLLGLAAKLPTVIIYILDSERPFHIGLEGAAIVIFCSVASRRNLLLLLLYVLWGSFYVFSSGLSARSWRLTRSALFMITVFEGWVSLGPSPWQAVSLPDFDLDRDTRIWFSLLVENSSDIIFSYSALWILSLCRYSPLSFPNSIPQAAPGITTVKSDNYADIILPYLPHILIVVLFIGVSLFADLIHLMLMLNTILIFARGSNQPAAWNWLRAFNFAAFFLLLVYQTPFPRWTSKTVFSKTADSNLGFRYFKNVGEALSPGGFISFLIVFAVLDVYRSIRRPVSLSKIDAQRERWSALGQARLEIAKAIFKRNRIAEVVSMKHVQAELRRQLHFLLSDTRRLGLEKLEDTEVWPSLPPERTAHFTVDKERKIVEWNAAVSLLTQWDATDAIGLRASDIFPRQYASNIKALAKRCIRSKSFRDAQNIDTQRLSFVKKESRLQIEIEVWVTPFTDGDGTICGVVFFMAPVSAGSVFDVTLNATSQAQTTNASAIFKTYDSSTEVVNGILNINAAAIRIAVDGNTIIAYSEAFIDMIDARAEEKSILGTSLSDHFRNDHDRERVANAVHEMAVSGGLIQIKSLLATLSSWLPANGDDANSEAHSVAGTAFVVEVTIEPVHDSEDALIAMQISLNRHHVEDVTISFFKTVLKMVKTKMSNFTNHVITLEPKPEDFAFASPSGLSQSVDNFVAANPGPAAPNAHIGFFALLFRFLLSHTQSICVSFFLLNLMVNGTLVSLVVPTGLFLYGLLERPRVPPRFWSFSIAFSEFVICLKLLLMFLVPSTPMHPDAPITDTLQGSQSLGWAQFFGVLNTQDMSASAFVALDFICLLCAAGHLHILWRQGIDHTCHECEDEIFEALVPVSPVNIQSPTFRSNSVSVLVSPQEPLDSSPQKSVVFSDQRRVSEQSDGKRSEPDLVMENDSKDQIEDKHLEPVAVVLSHLPVRVANFISRLLALTPSGTTDPTVKPGRSYYVPSFIIEMLSAVYILFGWNVLTASANPNQDQIRSQTFQGVMVGVLFSQILFIVWDRLNFLYRSVSLKLLHQYIQVIFFSYLMFYAWPKNRQSGFSSNGYLVLFFLFKSAYWWLSCLQIRAGYPAYTLHHRALFNRASKTRLLIFKIYRIIPFVAELEVLLDWVSIETSLDLFETFKLEDIYSNLYIIKGQLIYKREHRRGEPFPSLTKFTNGTLLFIGLLLVICLPLLLFSTASPVTNEVNNVERGSITLFLTPGNQAQTSTISFNLLETTSLSIAVASKSITDKLGSNVDSRSVQSVIAKGYSDSPWNLSPPSLASFTQTLKDTNTLLRFNIRFSFVHTDASTSEISIGKSSDMTRKDMDAMLAMLLKESTEPVVITGEFIPTYLKLSSKSTTTPIYVDKASTLFLQLQTQDGVSWWDLRKADGSGLSTITVSETTTSGLLAAVIAMSITTIYVTIVLAVGRLLRSVVQNQVYSIMYTDIHDVSDLMLLCEGIFVARKQKEFELEEALYRSLIRLFRSPDSLIQSTKRRDKLKLD